MKYKCELCGIGYKNRWQLNGHLTFHKRGYKPIYRKCPNCQKDFRVPTDQENQIYCSMKCFREDQKKRKTVYGIQKAKIDSYIKKQTVCEICGKDLTLQQSYYDRKNQKFTRVSYCLDHNHTTGKFRGILCQSCNRNLGWYEAREREVQGYLSLNNDPNYVLDKVR